MLYLESVAKLEIFRKWGKFDFCDFSPIKENFNKKDVFQEYYDSSKHFSLSCSNEPFSAGNFPVLPLQPAISMNKNLP